MSRPETVSYNDILRWDNKIDNDPLMDENLAQNPIIREVCYAGQWLVDRLEEIGCPDHLIGRIMYSAGKLCFGKKDPWRVHQDILEEYVDGTLIFDTDPQDLN
jgi:hypothetical protein